MGSARQVDFRDGSKAGSEMIGFDFGRGVQGIALDIHGANIVKGAKEAAIFRTYDASGAELEDYLLTSNAPTTFEFGAAVRFASLEASPWITNGGEPRQEPDFILQDFDVIA